MAYDMQPEKPLNSGENASYVSVRGDPSEEIAAHWEKLRMDASVLQPLGPSAWSRSTGWWTIGSG
ncbi:hypothetical protein [Lichenibacterium ramalinae]|jgi:hypothetical protein|uniref:hypothetical protein n=1 Tax=Lichenibacterium ramalinae TaxID=2316527 RepID=UPI001A92FDA6|nr:hypothetical protein [Lichenibacterium ramalinae]